MDKTVKPANDFFRYVNGTWLDNTEIPDRTRWGSFDELRQKTDADALAILKEAATNQNTNQIQIKGKANV
jgi:predicted metalloendopeptidase